MFGIISFFSTAASMLLVLRRRKLLKRRITAKINFAPSAKTISHIQFLGAQLVHCNLLLYAKGRDVSHINTNRKNRYQVDSCCCHAPRKNLRGTASSSSRNLLRLECDVTALEESKMMAQALH
jgi:hypothetical protein